MLRNIWGVLAVSLNCNPLSYQRGCALPSFAPNQGQTMPSFLPVMPPQRVTHTQFSYKIDAMCFWASVRVFAYTFCVCACVRSVISVPVVTQMFRLGISLINLSTSVFFLLSLPFFQLNLFVTSPNLFFSCKCMSINLHLPSSGRPMGNVRNLMFLSCAVMMVSYILYRDLLLWQLWSGALPGRTGVAKRGKYNIEREGKC